MLYICKFAICHGFGVFTEIGGSLSFGVFTETVRSLGFMASSPMAVSKRKIPGELKPAAGGGGEPQWHRMTAA
jgi:hypothetical protein